MPSNYDFVPTLIVHPDRLVCYSRFQGSNHKRFDLKELMLNPRANYHNNKISTTAGKKMSKAINYMVYLAKPKKLTTTLFKVPKTFKLSFVTLTLSSSQVHTDTEIKSKLLNQFLVEAKQRWNVVNYVWRAEKQSNGNLHFHIITDKFVPWHELRSVWNRIQNKLGYVSAYQNQIKEFHKSGFKVRTDLLKQWSYKQQIKAYKVGKANDFSNPNSTDIHSVTKVRNLASYVKKYMQKVNENEVIEGRLWGCSYELSNLKGASTEIDGFVSDDINKLVEKFKPRVYSDERCKIFFIEIDKVLNSDFPEIVTTWFNYITSHFESLSTS